MSGMSEAKEDNLQCLVWQSRTEAADNRRRMWYNAMVETQNLRPYRYDALCALIDGIEHVLVPNATNQSVEGQKRIR